MKFADSFDLKLSSSVNQVLTQYADNSNNSNSDIDLMFLWPDFMKINNYFILLESQSLLDHAPLTVDIFISQEFIFNKQWTIVRNGEKEENFVIELTNAIGNIDSSNISSREFLILFGINFPEMLTS